MATYGIVVQILAAGLEDTLGVPLSGGKVYTYAAGGSTPKTTYTDRGKTTPAANPIILSAYGTSLIFADGNYKFVVKDANDSTIYTWDNLNFLDVTDPLTVQYAADTGTGGTHYLIAPSPAISAYTAGQTFVILANQTNGGACDLNVNGLGAKSIKMPDGADPGAGVIQSGTVYMVTYNGTDFRLMTGAYSVTLTSPVLTYPRIIEKVSDKTGDYTIVYSDKVVRVDASGEAELVTNGGFTGNANGWTLGAAWRYGTNNIEKYQAGTTTLSQAITTVASNYYWLQFNIATVSGSETFVPIVGGTNGPTLPDIPGNSPVDFFHGGMVLAADNTGLAFSPSSALTMFLDNISMIRMVRMALPTASSVSGQSFTIQKTDTSYNKVIIIPNGAEKIDGRDYYILYLDNEGVVLQSDGTGWFTIGTIQSAYVEYYGTSYIEGWSAFTTNPVIRVVKNGRRVEMLISISGTSNSSIVTLTSPIPNYEAVWNASGSVTGATAATGRNNGTVIPAFLWGAYNLHPMVITASPSGPTLASTWTASGTKSISGLYVYETY